MKLEPHVSSTETLRIIGQSAASVSTDRVALFFASPCGQITPQAIDNYTDFLLQYFDGTIDKTLHNSAFHALKVAQNLPILACRVTDNELSSGIAFPSRTRVFVKDGKTLLSNQTVAKSAAVAGTYFKPDDETTWAIQIMDIYFCNPNYVKSESDGIDASAIRVEVEATYEDFIAGNLKANMLTFLTAVETYVNGKTKHYMKVEQGEDACSITVQSDEEVNIQGPCVSEADGDNVTKTAIYTPGNDVFAVALTSPSNFDQMTAEVSNVTTTSHTTDSGNYYDSEFDLRIIDEGAQEDDTYHLSTVLGAVDGYGSDIYLDSVNNLRTDIVVIPLNTKPTAALEDVAATGFGLVESTMDTNSDTLPLDLLNKAIAKVEELEDIRISLFYDCGMPVPAFQTRLIQTAQTFKAMAVLSTPNYGSNDLIEQFRRNLGQDSTFFHISCPWNSDRALAEWPVNIAASAYYLERLGNNIKSNVTFAPIYGKTTGLTSAFNLSLRLKSEDRESLLKGQINTIMYKQSENLSYFNNNLTGTSVSSDLQEEHVRRFVNMLRYDIDKLCEGFLSWDWDNDTCYKIQNAIQSYFTQSVQSLGRIPLDQNNPPIITATLNGRNKVKVTVDIYTKGSVKYINIYYNIMSLA